MDIKKFKNITSRNTLIQIVKSDKPDKKYKVILTNKKNVADFKLVYFGNSRYEHYKDNTPFKLYKDLNHLDKERRKLYRKRHSKIKTTKKLMYKYNKDKTLNNGSGGKIYELKYVKIKPTPAYKVEHSPAYYSWKFLW